ncbi:hypothetical protein TSUD_66550 [Trifolium subterraneum]|uniref:Pentacotripeptide-repeat region of PRORP domain-containing protein n=1 Tax=Trifolium subterraneum TaxID=3900 RepID=A0A2Z6MNI1_TRISU|nr:hypothetical protein TSUD_66550 [Trifolium subterraneum]
MPLPMRIRLPLLHYSTTTALRFSSSSLALHHLYGVRTFALPFLHQRRSFTYVSSDDSDLESDSSHSQPQFVSNTPLANANNNCLTRAPTLDESLILFYKLDPSSKSARVCNPLLKSLLKLGRTDDAHHLLDQMLQPDSKFPPDDFTGEIVFGDLVKRDRPGKGIADEEIVGLVTKLGEHGVFPDTFKLTQLISKLCGNRKNGLAWELLHTVMKLGGTVEAASCNALLTGLGREREFKKMNKLFAEMEEMKIHPSVITFGILINNLCKARRINEALGVFDKLRGKGEKSWIGVEPDVVLYNTLINGLCKVGREEDGNAVTYTALISAFCGVNNIDKAMQYFDEMLSSGCSPDAIVYYSLISGLSIAGRMDDASVVVSRLKRAGFGLDRECYNVLISGFCKKKKRERVYEMLNEMEKTGVKPDIVTYNTLVSYLGKAGDFATATKVMKKMIKEGLKPTVVTYGAVIHANCLNRNVDGAMEIFEEMCSTSMVPPNTVIYNILIDALCKNNNVERAVSLMDDMKVKGVRPNTTTYNAVLKGVRDKRMLDKGFELMDRMVEDACNPDYVTMEILTEWLSAIGEIEKLKLFVEGYRVSSNPSSLQT